MTDLHAMHEKASHFMADGAYDKAIELYTHILTVDPVDKGAIEQLMDIYHERDKFRYYLMRANSNIAEQKFDHAISDVKKAIGLEPESDEARIKLARLYKVTGKPLKAIDEFTNVITHHPEEMSSYFELVELYTLEDALESGVTICKRALEVFKDDTTFKNLLSKLYFDLGDYKMALETACDDIFKAKILLQDGQNDEAKKILDSLKGKSKEEIAAIKLLLAQYFYNTGSSGEALKAIEEYTNALGLNPISFQMKALVYEQLEDDFKANLNWGYCHKHRGKLEEALVEFINAYNIDPKDKEVLIELANLYEKNGEKYTAMDFWQKVYAIDEDKEAGKILGEFYFKEGDYKLAARYGKVAPEKEGGNTAVEEDEGLLNKIMNLFSKK